MHLMFSQSSELRRITLWIVLVKIMYLSSVCIALQLWPNFDAERSQIIDVMWFPTNAMRRLDNVQAPFTKYLTTWDSRHYLVLCEKGYSKGLHSCAFYPMWPLVIRCVSNVTGGSCVTIAMTLANIFSTAACVILYHIVMHRFGKSVALWCLVFLMGFPGSVFYQFMYSESLFLLLVMLLWLGLEREHYPLAISAACLLPLCRAVGIFCILPVVLHVLRGGPFFRHAFWQRWIADKAPTGAFLLTTQPSPGPPHWRLYTLLLAPLAGWAGYLGLMWSWTGNPFEGIQAQRFWGVHSITNLVNLWHFVAAYFAPTTWHDFRGSALDRCAFTLLVYCLPIIWRLGKDLVLWTCALGVLPAMSGMFTSFTRFESTVFPLFIGLAVFFCGIRRKWPAVVFLALSISLHGILLWRFVNYRWAG